MPTAGRQGAVTSQSVSLDSPLHRLSCGSPKVTGMAFFQRLGGAPATPRPRLLVVKASSVSSLAL
eukprot:3491584-Pyramimonas_sp.AAC.1